MDIFDLCTETLENPLGIDTRQPCFSWKLHSTQRGAMQTAYQVQVAADLEQWEAAAIWDSGKVTSDNSISVRYEGPAVLSRTRYGWRVRVWDEQNEPSEWSDPAWWEMGLLEEQEWTAEWIEAGWEEDPQQFQPCPFFRRAFHLPGEVRSARLYITARGLYESWLNGQRVGDQVFTPGFTAYDQRLQYQVYDVTTLLHQGDNALGAILGDGWYRGRLGNNGRRNTYGNRLGLLALLRIETTAGQVTVGTDSAWKAASGPILKSDPKDGEIYDARLEVPCWCTPAFEDEQWQAVRVTAHPKNNLVASLSQPVRKKETFRPVVLTTPNGETVLDFGQNLAGVVHMQVQGARGTMVTLQHGEALDKDGNFTISHVLPPKPSDGHPQIFQEDRYTLKGEGVEEYEPRFTVHGFRYVRLAGYPGTPSPDDFYSVAIYSDMPVTGNFSCSDPMLNQLHLNALWSMKSNFLDVPTDCPQRERAPWTGDAQIFAPSAAFLMDTRAFFRKWLQDLALEQTPHGMVSNYAPDVTKFNTGLSRRISKMLEGSSGWMDAATLIPWALYMAYGDAQILERQYESMKALVDFEASRARNVRWTTKFHPRYWLDKAYRERQRYLWDTGFHWGEWSEAGRSDPAAVRADLQKNILQGCPAVATAYLIRSAQIVAQSAALLGKQADSQKYHHLAEQAKAAYQAELIGSDGRIDPDRQASYVRVLAFDLAPEALKSVILDRLAQMISDAGNHLGTGFLSTVFLLPVLADHGRLDVAYDLLMQQTRPSWLYEVAKGATTIWETWEGIAEDGTPHASLNHYSPGAVVNFLHQYVAGIAPIEPGYKRFRIHPQPGGGLTWARASYNSVYGMIASSWEIENNTMRLNVTIPANTQAVVTFPEQAVGQLTESGLPFSTGPFLKQQSRNGYLLELGSGYYAFEYPLS
jgi:alpha-L-rhamnosidase